MRKTKLIATLGLSLLALTLFLMPFTGCSSETEETIVFGDGGWDSIQLHDRITGFILENGYGYQVDYVPGETIALLTGLSRGDIDVITEIWVENQQEAYDKTLADGSVIDLGDNFWDNWQGWLVPTYMIENGDLPAGISVEDMPQYWELFKDPEDPSKGRFYSGVAGWEAEKICAEKLTAYGLDDTYNAIVPGTNAALSASMVAAYEKGEPWFGYNWTPTWILGKLDMTPVEEPAYDADVWNASHACAFPAVHVNIAVNQSMPERAPELVEFFTAYSTQAAQTSAALAYMQDSGASLEDAAIWFLKEYESSIDQWVPADVAAKVKAALP